LVCTLNNGTTAVDLRLSVVKPTGAQWIVKLYDYIKGHPKIIITGFKNVGIVDSLTLGISSVSC